MLCSVSTFGLVLLFLIIGAFFALIALSIGKFFRPDNPTKEKLTTYECGEETILGSWGKFYIHFYLIALVFVLFEVEIIFLFPWSKILTDSKLQALESSWKVYALTEGLLFILILVIGLAYLWKKNLLNWQFDLVPKDSKEVNFEDTLSLHKQRTSEQKHTPIVTKDVAIETLYQKINTRYD